MHKQRSIRSYSATSGAAQWTQTPQQCPGWSYLTVGADNVVYATTSCEQMADDGGDDSHLFAVDAATGVTLWDVVAPGGAIDLLPFDYAVIGIGGTLLVGFNFTMQCYSS